MNSRFVARHRATVLLLPVVLLRRLRREHRAIILNITSALEIPDRLVASAMQAALSAARPWEGATAPNPPVGCTLLDSQGRIITTAAHHGAGTLHAEALAVKQVRETGQGDRIHTAVVTLEPCNHHGRTPPCTEALLSTSVRRVVIGTADPNPHVKGGGAAKLRQAGLDVRFFDGDRLELERLLGPFRKRVTCGLPWVTVKQAINHGGNMIPPAGQKTFTSQGSLLVAHALRRRADAIFTGSGTILADEPKFTVRLLPDHLGKHRSLVLFDRRRRIQDAYVEAAMANGFCVKFADDLGTALRRIAAAGGLEVLVEAGPGFTAHVLQGTLWDEHVKITQTAEGDMINILQNGGTDVLRHH